MERERETGAGEDAFAYRGNRLGMPETGPGSVPGVGRRLLALALDWILSLAVAYGLLGADPGDGSATVLLVFALMTAVLLCLFGTTLGKRITGIGIASTGERALPWPLAVVIRTALLCLVIPAVIYDRDQRGLHDRAAGTISRRL
ncbi:RDD family protein [Nocardiopsis composta]|uniref:Putative RDD family membrane protein YckC n=1 Tax=Nocardiopsis composta TaxID=157465 RepID=A0A7W8QT23_9ACTN|nr:RDD family protein [Nocardiopsis composta]MBB5435644.1 putative RDD family membrane protein YckC [Nocardiopsis composta]